MHADLANKFSVEYGIEVDYRRVSTLNIEGLSLNTLNTGNRGMKRQKLLPEWVDVSDIGVSQIGSRETTAQVFLFALINWYMMCVMSGMDRFTRTSSRVLCSLPRRVVGLRV